MADVFVRFEDNAAVLSEPVEEGLQGMGSIRSGENRCASIPFVCSTRKGGRLLTNVRSDSL
jgi:hypothetical protein